MPFDFFTEYCRIHRAVYGRDPCTRSQWDQWVRGNREVWRPSGPSCDVQFDHDKEREGDAQ